MNTKIKGKFIVIEGIEGAGKTTAQQTIINVLKQNNIDNLVFTREPGGTKVAEKLREIIKYGIDGEPITNKAELLLLYAARIQLVENIIKPALMQNKWVIGDRHDLSSQAYQGGGRELNANLLKSLKTLILEDFSPDLIIYLDVTPEIGLARAKQRGQLDRIEQEKIEFFAKVRNKYLELIKHMDNCIIINASNSLEQVTLELETKLQNWLSKNI